MSYKLFCENVYYLFGNGQIFYFHIILKQMSVQFSQVSPQEIIWFTIERIDNEDCSSIEKSTDPMIYTINDLESPFIHRSKRDFRRLTQISNTQQRILCTKFIFVCQKNEARFMILSVKRSIDEMISKQKNVDISLRPQRAENQLWREMSVADKSGFKKPKCNFCNSDIRHDFKLCKKNQFQKNLKAPRKGLI